MAIPLLDSLRRPIYIENYYCLICFKNSKDNSRNKFFCAMCHSQYGHNILYDMLMQFSIKVYKGSSIFPLSKSEVKKYSKQLNQIFEASLKQWQPNRRPK